MSEQEFFELYTKLTDAQRYAYRELIYSLSRGDRYSDEEAREFLDKHVQLYENAMEAKKALGE